MMGKADVADKLIESEAGPEMILLLRSPSEVTRLEVVNMEMQGQVMPILCHGNHLPV